LEANIRLLAKKEGYEQGSTRKREQMIHGDKHKRKIALVHRGRTRA
jgi:hypothetical protein